MQHVSHSVEIASAAPNRCPEHRTAASYERELERYRRAELQLREIIALDESLLRQKDQTIQEDHVWYDYQSDHPADCRCYRRQWSGVRPQGLQPRRPGNTIVGAIGGVVARRRFRHLYPRWPGRPAVGSMWGLSSDNLSAAGRAAAILTIIVGLMKNMMASK